MKAPSGLNQFQRLEVFADYACASLLSRVQAAKSSGDCVQLQHHHKGQGQFVIATRNIELVGATPRLEVKCVL